MKFIEVPRSGACLSDVCFSPSHFLKFGNRKYLLIPDVAIRSQFNKFRHRDYAHMHPCNVLVQKLFVLGQIRSSRSNRHWAGPISRYHIRQCLFPYIGGDRCRLNRVHHKKTALVRPGKHIDSSTARNPEFVLVNPCFAHGARSYPDYGWTAPNTHTWVCGQLWANTTPIVLALFSYPSDHPKLESLSHMICFRLPRSLSLSISERPISLIVWVVLNIRRLSYLCNHKLTTLITLNLLVLSPHGIYQTYRLYASCFFPRN